MAYSAFPCLGQNMRLPGREKKKFTCMLRMHVELRCCRYDWQLCLILMAQPLQPCVDSPFLINSAKVQTLYQLELP